jgi:mediator of RNA polymerase II transcription subunit 13
LWEEQDQRDELLNNLRQRRILVQSALLQKKVCVFGGFDAAEAYLANLGWHGMDEAGNSTGREIAD